MQIKGIVFNWGYTIEYGEFGSEYTVGNKYPRTSTFPDEVVKEIKEKIKKTGERFYEVIFESGDKVEVFNVNTVYKLK